MAVGDIVFRDATAVADSAVGVIENTVGTKAGAGVLRCGDEQAAASEAQTNAQANEYDFMRLWMETQFAPDPVIC